MIFLLGHTFQLKVLLSAMGNAHSPPSSTSFRKTMIVRYLTVKKKHYHENTLLEIAVKLVFLDKWRVTYLPTEPAIFRAIQATRFVMSDFFAVMVTVIMTSFFVTYHLGHKTKDRETKPLSFSKQERSREIIPTRNRVYGKKTRKMEHFFKNFLGVTGCNITICTSTKNLRL